MIVEPAVAAVVLAEVVAAVERLPDFLLVPAPAATVAGLVVTAVEPVEAAAGLSLFELFEQLVGLAEQPVKLAAIAADYFVALSILLLFNITNHLI